MYCCIVMIRRKDHSWQFDCDTDMFRRVEHRVSLLLQKVLKRWRGDRHISHFSHWVVLKYLAHRLWHNDDSYVVCEEDREMIEYINSCIDNAEEHDIEDWQTLLRDFIGVHCKKLQAMLSQNENLPALVRDISHLACDLLSQLKIYLTTSDDDSHSLDAAHAFSQILDVIQKMRLQVCDLNRITNTHGLPSSNAAREMLDRLAFSGKQLDGFLKIIEDYIHCIKHSREWINSSIALELYDHVAAQYSMENVGYFAKTYERARLLLEDYISNYQPINEHNYLLSEESPPENRYNLNDNNTEEDRISRGNVRRGIIRILGSIVIISMIVAVIILFVTSVINVFVFIGCSIIFFVIARLLFSNLIL